MSVDLFEVRRWPIAKKLAYQEHMAAEAELREQYDGAGDVPAMDGMDMPSNPQAAMQQAQSMGNMGGRGGAPASGDDVHPHLRGYDNIIHVDDDDEGGEE